METSHEYRHCKRKIRYASMTEALFEIPKIYRRESRRGVDTGVLNAYECCYCAGFHVGHRPGYRKPDNGEPNGPGPYAAQHEKHAGESPSMAGTRRDGAPPDPRRGTGIPHAPSYDLPGPFFPTA